MTINGSRALPLCVVRADDSCEWLPRLRGRLPRLLGNRGQLARRKRQPAAQVHMALLLAGMARARRIVQAWVDQKSHIGDAIETVYSA